MKKVTSTYYCDRCKKELDTLHWMVSIPNTCNASTASVFQTKDLCDDCLKELFRWFENRITECPFETYGMG